MQKVSRKIYAEHIEEDFYESQAKSVNPLRSWFHTSRQKKLLEWVKELYFKGMKIADLGCGNCVWNSEKLPVIGVDYSKKMLERAKRAGRLCKCIVRNINHTNFKANSIDLVVISEVLEHVPDYRKTLNEIHRILKPKGKLLVTVPYDTFFSLWKPFFAVQCFLQGSVYGNEYYKRNCGHIHHFSPKSLRSELEKSGFKITRYYNHGFFTIFMLAEKKQK